MCLGPFCRAPRGVLSCASGHFIVCPEAREQFKVSRVTSWLVRRNLVADEA